MRFKVCILTAGKGTRMGEFSQLTNKSLLPFDDKAVITSIIEKFPDAEEFVIAVGFRSQDVRAYLGMAHPDLQFSFVIVNPFEGPESGPGYSLWSCREKLNLPFYAVCADTLWTGTLASLPDQSWIGVSPVSAEQTLNYCMVESKNGVVVNIRDKEPSVDIKSYKAFVGLFYIAQPEIYFEGLKLKRKINNEYQLSEGLSFLKDKVAVKAVDIQDWQDLGTEEKYLKAIEKAGRLRKSSEIFYRVGTRVIKFYEDSSIAEERVKRAQLFPRIFPQIVGHSDHFYAYEFMPGINLYQRNSVALFEKLLGWLKTELWHLQPAPSHFAKSCQDFFEKQTQSRLQEFLRRNPSLNGPCKINGASVPAISDQWDSLPWPELNQGVPSIIHGDLQFGNILYDDKTDRFRLVDWRQSFAGDLSVGDINYDFAKLLSGYILDLDQLGLGRFTLHESGNEVAMTHTTVENYRDYDQVLRRFFSESGYSYKKVRILAGLIFLRMSALHPAPVDRFLFYMGRSFLNHDE